MGDEVSSGDTAYHRLAASKLLKLMPQATVIDAFEEPLREDPILVDGGLFDVIAYWMKRKYTSPELAEFAFDTLAIPLMSDDTERSFSHILLGQLPPFYARRQVSFLMKIQFPNPRRRRIFFRVKLGMQVTRQRANYGVATDSTMSQIRRIPCGALSMY